MIDWDRIDELRKEIGPEDFAEVAEIFLDELGETIDALSGGTRPDSLEASMHFIKGCALNLGFSALAGFASDAERLAAEGQSPAVDLLALHDCFDTSRMQFLSRFGDPAAA